MKKISNLRESEKTAVAASALKADWNCLQTWHAFVFLGCVGKSTFF